MTQPISPETVVDDDEPFAEPVPDADADEDAEHEEAAEEGAHEPAGAPGHDETPAEAKDRLGRALAVDPAQPPVDSEKEMRAIGKKIDSERDRHAKKLGDILGDASTETLPCPLCFEGLMGFVLPMDAGNLPEEQKAAALSFLGEEMTSGLRQAEGAVMCDRCDGYGQLEWPSRNPHLQKQTCPKCSGNGYVIVTPPQATVTSIAPQTTTTYTPPPNEVGPCPICQAPNSAGKPHFCNPIAASG